MTMRRMICMGAGDFLDYPVRQCRRGGGFLSEVGLATSNRGESGLKALLPFFLGGGLFFLLQAGAAFQEAAELTVGGLVADLDEFLGPVELHDAGDVPGDGNDHVRRIGGELGAGDGALHRVEGLLGDVEHAPAVRALAGELIVEAIEEAVDQTLLALAVLLRQRLALAGQPQILVRRAVEVHRHGEVGGVVEGGRDGHRIEDSAIQQGTAVLAERHEEERQGDGGPDGLEQRAGIDPDLLFTGDVRRHRGEAHRQVPYFLVAHEVFQHVHDAGAVHEAGLAEGKIEQPHDIALADGRGPLGIFVQLACRITATDERTHRRAHHGEDLQLVFLDPADHADVGVAPGAAAAQHQRDLALVTAHAHFLRSLVLPALAAGSYRRLSSCFSTLPCALIGSASTKRTCFGSLYLARRSAQWASSSSGSALAPAQSRITARPACPHFSSSTPTTAAAATSGRSHSTFSTSAGWTFSPPEIYMSL